MRPQILFSIVILAGGAWLVGAGMPSGLTEAVAASRLGQRERPQLDVEQVERTQTATFAVGCFWSVDSRFGGLPGVVRTRCGYAGGQGTHPTYEHLQDHVESLQLDFDPALTSYPKLVQVFFEHHPCTRANAPKTHPILFFADEQQHREADRALREEASRLGFKPAVSVLPLGHFFVAEPYHQKYHLRQTPALWKEFNQMYPGNQPAILSSSAAMRVNSYLAGFGSAAQLQEELPKLGLSTVAQDEIQKNVSQR